MPSNSGTSLASLVFVSNGLSVVFLVPDLVLLLWCPFQFQDLPLKFRTGFSFFVFCQACHVLADRVTFSASSFLEKVSSPSKMPTKFCSMYSPILAVSSDRIFFQFIAHFSPIVRDLKWMLGDYFVQFYVWSSWKGVFSFIMLLSPKSWFGGLAFKICLIF